LFGFGHNFPEGEALKEADFQERFFAPKLIGPTGELLLAAGSEARLFVSPPAGPGTYFILTESRESFFSRTPDGFSRKSKKDDPAVVTCSFGANFGKSVLVLGNGAKTSDYSKPQGQKLEIVPQKDPSLLKAGESFPVLVLFEGKPLPRATVNAYYAGFTEDNSAFAFSGNTNKDGLVNIVTVKGGEWLAKVTQSTDYSDASTCDKLNYSATLAFTVAQ
jgi:uncharacterized GH25 family protein